MCRRGNASRLPVDPDLVFTDVFQQKQKQIENCLAYTFTKYQSKRLAVHLVIRGG